MSDGQGEYVEKDHKVLFATTTSATILGFILIAIYLIWSFDWAVSAAGVCWVIVVGAVPYLEGVDPLGPKLERARKRRQASP